MKLKETDWLIAPVRINYVRSNGFHCPFCGSTNMDKRLGGYGGERDSFDPSLEDHPEVMSKVVCRECQERWTDVLTLTRILPYKAEEGEDEQ